MSPEGLTRLASPYPVGITLDRVASAARERGMTVFARIDHATGAVAAGLQMLPAEVLIFGTAVGGTPLMRAAPTIAIDLPLKALAWQDESGATWLAFNDPAWLARRHRLPAALHADVEVVSAGLIAVARAAVAVDGSAV